MAEPTEVDRCPEHGHVVAFWRGDNWYMAPCPDCPQPPPLDVSGWQPLGFVDETGGDRGD